MLVIDLTSERESKAGGQVGRANSFLSGYLHLRNKIQACVVAKTLQADEKRREGVRHTMDRKRADQESQDSPLGESLGHRGRTDLDLKHRN